MKSDESNTIHSCRNPWNCGRDIVSIQIKIYMIRKDLINIGIQMFSRKRLANFFFLLLSMNYATLFPRRGRLGAEKISREKTFDLTFIVYRSPLTDHFPDVFDYFSYTLSYARRPSSIRYPFTQSLTHSRAHFPVTTSKKNTYHDQP